MGIVSPVGNTISDAWEIAGEVKDFDITQYMIVKEARRMDIFIHYGMAAAMQAVNDAGIEDVTNSEIDPDRIGVNIGSGIGGLPMIEKTDVVYHKKGPRKISPFFIPSTIINMIAGNLSIKYNFRGPNLAIVTACTTATHCIGNSARMIEYGDADLMVAGGAESCVTPLAVGGFASAKALSTRNDDPGTASRPWDTERDGFVLGEGAGILVLEEMEHAKRRKAKIYAEVVGFGMSADANHMTAPCEDGEGAARCMTAALKNSCLDASEVNYINAHGTSTQLGDIAETTAVKRCFGEQAKKLVMNSTKSMTGHLLGAAGGVEAIFTALAIHHQISPPTINIFNQDPQCDLDYVPNTARKMKIEVALSNSFGFGGTNGTLILKKL